MLKKNTYGVRKKNEIKLLIKKLGAPWETAGEGGGIIFHSFAK